MKIAGYEKISLQDYPDHISCIIFTQGCNLKCPFCQNSTLIPFKNNDLVDRYAKKVLYRYIPGVKPLPVQAWILRHKSFLDVSSNSVFSNPIDCPYCHFILEFDNYSFQIVVPAITKDALFKQPEIMMFPGTVDAAPEIAWDNVNNIIIVEMN